MNDEYSVNGDKIKIEILSNLDSFTQFPDLLSGSASNSTRLPIKNIGLSRRSENALLNAGISYINDLKDFPDDRLRKIPNLGKKSIAEIYRLIIPLLKNNDLNNNSIIFSSLRQKLGYAGSKGVISELMNIGVETIDQLILLDREFLQAIPNIGRKKINAILFSIEKYKKMYPENLPVTQEIIPEYFLKPLTGMNFSRDEKEQRFLLNSNSTFFFLHI